MKLRKLIYAIPIVALGVFTGCSENEICQDGGEENKVKFVKVEEVSAQTNKSNYSFNGSVKEKSLTSLAFRVGGPLIEVNVDAGDYVQKGDVIARIDPRDYQVNLDTRKAQYLQTKGEYDRYVSLRKQDKIPENTFEKIEAGYLMAKAAYKNAQHQLNDTELRAPMSGYIHEKMIENFNTVGPGIPVVSILDISKLEVVVNVSETKVQKMKNCTRSLMTVPSVNAIGIPLTYVSINEKAGKDGLYETRLMFNNIGDYDIMPGMAAEVSIVCDATKEHNLRISSSAVFHQNEKSFVWIYNPNSTSIEKQQVDLGQLKSNGTIEILAGLQPGSQIVTAGIHSLSNGQEVKPIEQKSASNIGGLL